MKIFDNIVKPIIQYVGAIGAFLTSIAYIILVVVYMRGFTYTMDVKNTVMYASVNAIMGFIIMQMLKYQGISFAKAENRELIDRYYHKDRTKKLHSIKFYWCTSVIKDIIIKCASIAMATGCLMYITIEAHEDENLLTLALVNLVLFICFGLLALNSAYEHYKNEQIPLMLKKLEEQDEQRHSMVKQESTDRKEQE